MAENPEDLIVTDAELRRQLPALAKELKIGGSGVEPVSGTVTLDASGAPIREFFTTGATTFKANGADTLISSFTALVWRRSSTGSWGYQIVQDAWVTPAPTPDTTAPVAGTLSVAVTDVKADLTVSGASDNRAVTGYSFSKDNGATWTAYQDSSAYTFTGLTASTAYQFRHRVKDAAGNVTTGTAVSRSTTAEQVTLKTALTDTFTRADGALPGHVTNTGQAWGGAVGAVSIVGGQMKPAAVNTSVWVPVGAQAREVTYIATFTSAGSTECFPWHTGTTHGEPGNGVRAYVNQNGQVSLTNLSDVSYNTAGGTNNYTPVGHLTLPLNTAHTIKVTLVGGKVGLHVNGALIIEGTPTAGATSAGTAVGFSSNPSYNNLVDNLEVKVAA